MASYGGPKGLRDFLVDDRLRGNLAPPGDPEESASHHSSEITNIMISDVFLKSVRDASGTLGITLKNRW